MLVPSDQLIKSNLIFKVSNKSNHLNRKINGSPAFQSIYKPKINVSKAMEAIIY